ncbi:MAG TPA: class I SAM-dependent methyltransferase [Gaiellaceae bacterium]|nr:class I SAM-dependent methyltransferase [Gaiellaceae bacterium]
MPDFAELKQRHAAVWSAGAFEDVADTIHDMHVALVEALDPQPGERWLDVGCGAGNVAELAAGAGARVTGIDLSPRLIGVATARAEAGGFEVDYRVGDAENLDAEDASFDKVTSSVGMIFAPDHDAAARELARVTRPGGRLAFSAWTPEGTIGQMFRAFAPFQPPPQPGAGVPLAWGEEPYVREKLGDAFELSIERRMSHFEDESPEHAWEYFAPRFGPTRTMLENLDPERRTEFEEAGRALYEQGRQLDGRYLDEREYLLVTGERR